MNSSAKILPALLCALAFGCASARAQDAPAAAPSEAPAAAPDAKQRAKTVRDLAKQGATAMPQLVPYLKDSDIDVRIEAVKAIASVGGPSSLDPLIQALRDNDPEVQTRATNGLVNFYLPGYTQTGIGASIKKAGGAIKGRFSDDSDDRMIPAYVEVRPDVVEGIASVLSGGASMDARANAARALGVLRQRSSVPALSAALHAKNDDIIFESVVALEKINDPSAGPAVAFLLKDFTKRIQIAALDVTGLLHNRSALPDVREVFARAKDKKVKRSALEALSQMPEAQDLGLLQHYLLNKDPDLRAPAAEGIGRLGDAANRSALDKAFENEPKPAPRMAAAFGDVLLGNRDMTELAPLRYLINQLNSAAWNDVALAYLVELARYADVRQAIYPDLASATKDEKTGLARVLAASGGHDSISYANTLSRDPNPEVAQAGLDALRTLRARFP